MANESALLEDLQKLINEQFNKVLKLTIDDKDFNIAIRRDEIPQIQSLVCNHDRLIILFSESSFSNKEINLDDEFEFLFDQKGKIEGVILKHPFRLKSSKNIVKIGKIIINEVRNIPEGNTNRDAVETHIKTRIAHAISDIFRYLSQNNISNQSNLILQKV